MAGVAVNKGGDAASGACGYSAIAGVVTRMAVDAVNNGGGADKNGGGADKNGGALTRMAGGRGMPVLSEWTPPHRPCTPQDCQLPLRNQVCTPLLPRMHTAPTSYAHGSYLLCTRLLPPMHTNSGENGGEMLARMAVRLTRMAGMLGRMAGRG
eukprot:1290256-Rhodomonas_salina.3